MSLDMPLVHQQYGKLKCAYSVEALQATVKELDLFLEREPQYKGSLAVLIMRCQLLDLSAGVSSIVL